MSAVRFVIRAAHFCYDDEVDAFAGVGLHDVFEDRATAEARLRELRLERLRGLDPDLVESLFRDPGLADRVDRWMRERCGRGLFATRRDWLLRRRPTTGYDRNALRRLDDDDLLEFGRLTGESGYELFELAGRAPLLVACDPDGGEPLRVTLENGLRLMFHGVAPDDVLAREGELVTRLIDDGGVDLSGPLDALSDRPVLLGALIGSSAALERSGEDGGIGLLGPLGGADAAALNELLRRPIYVLREMDVETVLALERAPDAVDRNEA